MRANAPFLLLILALIFLTVHVIGLFPLWPAVLCLALIHLAAYA